MLHVTGLEQVLQERLEEGHLASRRGGGRRASRHSTGQRRTSRRWLLPSMLAVRRGCWSPVWTRRVDGEGNRLCMRRRRRCVCIPQPGQALGKDRFPAVRGRRVHCWDFCNRATGSVLALSAASAGLRARCWRRAVLRSDCAFATLPAAPRTRVCTAPHLVSLPSVVYRIQQSELE